MSDGYPPLWIRTGSGREVGVTGRYQCQWCRFPVDAKKRKNKGSENQADGNVASLSGTVGLLDTPQGCPFCGQFNWARGMTQKKETKFLGRRRMRPRLWRRVELEMRRF